MLDMFQRIQIDAVSKSSRSPVQPPLPPGVFGPLASRKTHLPSMQTKYKTILLIGIRIYHMQGSARSMLQYR